MTLTIEEIIRRPGTGPGPAVPRMPKGASIYLKVCACYKMQRLEFDPRTTLQVASILGLDPEELQTRVIQAKLTGPPQVVGCFRQQDVVEQKMHQLQSVSRFILRACHSLHLVED